MMKMKKLNSYDQAKLKAMSDSLCDNIEELLDVLDVTDYRISDKTYQAVLDLLGSEKAMIELVLVMGHYIGLATQLNILRVPNPGERQFFEN